MKFIRQLMVILSVCFAAELMEELIPIPVAASIYGLVLMLAGLISGLIPLEKVEGAADFLVEAMPFFFIPPTVGVMTSAEALRELLLPLTVISVVTTVLIMAVTGRVSQGIIRRQHEGAGGTHGGRAERMAGADRSGSGAGPKRIDNAGSETDPERMDGTGSETDPERMDGAGSETDPERMDGAGSETDPERMDGIGREENPGVTEKSEEIWR